MLMSEDEGEGEKLMAGLGEIRDLEAELEAIGYENDPEAMEKQYETMDLMISCSMAIAPLRKKMSTCGCIGGSVREDVGERVATIA